MLNGSGWTHDGWWLAIPDSFIRSLRRIQMTSRTLAGSGLSGFFGEVASGKLQEIPPKFRRWCHLKSIVVVILVSSLVGKWRFSPGNPHWTTTKDLGAIQVDVVGQGINKAGNPSYTEVSSWATDLKKRWIFHCPVWLPDGIVHYISRHPYDLSPSHYVNHHY